MRVENWRNPIFEKIYILAINGPTRAKKGPKWGFKPSSCSKGVELIFRSLHISTVASNDAPLWSLQELIIKDNSSFSSLNNRLIPHFSFVWGLLLEMQHRIDFSFTSRIHASNDAPLWSWLQLIVKDNLSFSSLNNHLIPLWSTEKMSRFSFRWEVLLEMQHRIYFSFASHIHCCIKWCSFLKLVGIDSQG